MILDTKDGFVFVSHSLDGLVVQVDAVDRDLRRQACRFDCEAMVLRGDLDFAGFEVLDGLIGAAMAKFQFESLAPKGLPQDLVTEANPKDRDTGLGEVMNRLN